MKGCVMMTGVVFACLACGSDTTVPAGSGTNPQFERLKALAGEWQGTSLEGVRTVSTFRLVGGGSAVLHTLWSVREGESVTVYYPEGGELRADHYSRLKNRSSMVSIPSVSPGTIRFTTPEMVSVASHYLYEGALILRLIDYDHHTEFWRTMDGGKGLRLAETRFTRVR
jgi:hypothetical protein